MQQDSITEHRTLTLDIYRRLTQTLSEANKPIPESLITSAANLEQNRFLLAILGKVKAGKSTFINALLKCDLLPTDSLQATSAIIEVFHSQTPSLTVTFADGHIDTTTSQDQTLSDLKQKLREVASIRAADRDIPTAQLDGFIIEHYNPSTRRAEWDDKSLNLYLHSDLPNIHQLPEDELRKRSRSYLETHRDGINVPQRIEVGFPSDYQLGHFRIVDTPGLCAKGGFASRTLGFLHKADAVIYLHKDEPAEETLHNALQNVIPEKTKKHMLLVVTHKSQRSRKGNEDYLTETIKCCPQIKKDNIFIIDSLTEIILQSVHNKDFCQIKAICGAEPDSEWDNCTAKLIGRADGDVPAFLDLMEEQSNMRRLRERFTRMAEDSLRLQIESLLDFIEELFKELESDAIDRRDLYGKKKKDPQTFAAEMARQEHEMNELEIKCKKSIADLKRDFNLHNSTKGFGARLQKLVSDKEAEVNGKEFGASDTAKTADDYLTKLDQDIHDAFCEMKKEIADHFRKRIGVLEETIQAEITITVPKIPLPELLSQLRKEATETCSREVDKPGFWNRVVRFITFGHAGKEIETYKQLIASKFFKSCKSAYLNSLRSKADSFAKDVEEQTAKVCETYATTMSGKLDIRRDLIQEQKQKKEANDDLQRKYDDEASNVERVQTEIQRCKNIRGKL